MAKSMFEATYTQEGVRGVQGAGGSSRRVRVSLSADSGPDLSRDQLGQWGISSLFQDPAQHIGYERYVTEFPSVSMGVSDRRYP